jgi:phosphatidylserine/phosphatidylglycerophosphate/cardiolipin synthase-like enzyme
MRGCAAGDGARGADLDRNPFFAAGKNRADDCEARRCGSAIARHRRVHVHAAATIRAHRRGVRVQIIMDPTSAAEKSSLASTLSDAGIGLRVARSKHAFQHSKYMIIDQAIVVTGSFNFTTRADERNSENLLVIRNAPQVVKAFLDDYQKLRADSVSYGRAAVPGER